MKIQQVLTATLFVVAFTDARRATPFPKRPFVPKHYASYGFGLDAIEPQKEEKVVKEVKAVKKPEQPAFVTRRHVIMETVEAAMSSME